METVRAEEVKTSLYLARRADALLGALRFFTASRGDAAERRLQFLAQSDFWEWEMDNLIFSFTNFAERSKTWHSTKEVIDRLWNMGIAMDQKRLNLIGWRRGWQAHPEERRVAPLHLLRETIDLWNRLIEMVEAQFVSPIARNSKRFNIKTRQDLGSLKKRMPEMLASA